MGSSESRPALPPSQVVALDNPNAGESKIYRHYKFGDKLVETCYPDVTTLYDSFQRGVRIAPNRPCLGWRINDGPFVWQTYGQINNRLMNFGSGLLALVGADTLPSGSFVGIDSKNRAEWVICEQACNAYGLTTVPLYDTLGAEAITFIANQTEMSVIVCSSDKLDRMLKDCSQRCPHLRTLVYMDPLDAEKLAAYNALAAEHNVRLYSFADVESKGSEPDARVPARPPKPTDIATISYTSGTTGNPKGVLLSHRAFVADAAGIILHGVEIGTSDVHMSYLPLAHIFERIIQVCLFQCGAACAFFRGDVLKLFDDIALLAPTFFVSVPRLYNKLYDKVLANANSLGFPKKNLFHSGLETKIKNLRESGDLRHSLWDSLVFDKVKARLGGRCRFLVTGSAPLSNDVKEMVMVAMQAPMFEGYGQTECAAGGTVTMPGDNSIGHVGCPLPCVEIKLVDVPEMNYTSQDKPNPRGEVCFRGPNLFSGYYKEPAKTAEALDSEGWLHSGDVGELLPGGRLRIFDRKKNIFKLSQGEYIAPEKIEGVLAKCLFIAQVFIHGDSLQSVLVSVIVPDFDALATWAKEHLSGVDPTDKKALCEHPAVNKLILGDVQKICKEAKLQSFEVPKRIHLCPTPFSEEDDLLTPTFKLKRPQAKAFFLKEIDAMYKSFNDEMAKKPPTD